MHLFFFLKNIPRIQTASTYYNSATERDSFSPNDGRRFLSRKSFFRFKKRKEEERRTGKEEGGEERVEARSGPFQRTTLFTCWRYGLPPLLPYFFLVTPSFSSLLSSLLFSLPSPPPPPPFFSLLFIPPSLSLSLLTLALSRKWSRS